MILRKEARALLPYWAGTLIALIGFRLTLERGAELSSLAYCFGCAMLGGMAFGGELASGTLPMLLSQPISRAAVFWTKMLVLAAALLTVTLALGPTFFEPMIDVGDERIAILPWILLSVFCSAPLFTLIADRALGGAILSVSIPGSFMTLAMVAHRWVSFDPRPMIIVPTIIWCPIALVLSYFCWTRYQMRDAASVVLLTRSVRRGPLATLIMKELRLQYGTFALVIPLWCTFFVGGIFSDERGGHWPAILSVVTGLSLLVLPLIASAIALGEERSLGIADWQLSLAPARLQWLAKMTVTLPTSLLLGLLLPILMKPPVPSAPMLILMIIAHLLLTHLAIFAASIARGTMPAVLLALGFWSAAAIAVLQADLIQRFSSTQGAIAMACAIAVLHALSFSKFRYSQRARET